MKGLWHGHAHLFSPDDDANTLMMVLRQGEADVNTCTMNGYSLLDYAVRFQAQRCVRALLDAKADPKPCSPSLRTHEPLMGAVWTGNSTILRMLLEAKADPTRRDLDGSTALHLAAELDRFVCVRLLLSYMPHSSLSTRNRNGFTALDRASEQCAWPSATLLVAAGARGGGTCVLDSFVQDVISGMEQCRLSARALYGVLKFRLGLGRDMARLVAQATWSTRMNEAWHRKYK